MLRVARKSFFNRSLLLSPSEIAVARVRGWITIPLSAILEGPLINSSIDCTRSLSMRSIREISLVFLLALVSTLHSSRTNHSMAQQSVDNMKAYPAPTEGMKRCVIHLESRENEEDFQIEIQVGKTVEVDDVNLYVFSGKLEEVSIEGWGFPKYVVESLGNMSSTRAAVDPNRPKVKRFVRLGWNNQLLRYNSKLPVVVYVPKDAEVRLRIWVAAPTPLTVNEG